MGRQAQLRAVRFVQNRKVWIVSNLFFFFSLVSIKLLVRMMPGLIWIWSLCWGTLVGGQMGSEGESGKVLTQIQQTTRALQQLGVILSAAFLVSFLFMVMMAVEKTWEQLMKNYENCEGKGQRQEDDPAALVGTFKRYK